MFHFLIILFLPCWESAPAGTILFGSWEITFLKGMESLKTVCIGISTKQNTSLPFFFFFMLTFTASQLELTRCCLKGPKPEKKGNFNLCLLCNTGLGANMYAHTYLFFIFVFLVMEVEIFRWDLAFITLKGIVFSFFACTDIRTNPAIFIHVKTYLWDKLNWSW